MMGTTEDLTNMAYPDKEQLRRWIIRLDMLVMLAARRIFTKPVRVARYLAPDSSPQGKYDYLNCVEELMRRSSPSSLTTLSTHLAALNGNVGCCLSCQ